MKKPKIFFVIVPLVMLAVFAVSAAQDKPAEKAAALAGPRPLALDAEEDLGDPHAAVLIRPRRARLGPSLPP